MIEAITRKPLRWVLGGFQRLRQLFWYVRRPRTFGTHAVAITPGGSVVLVRLRYARGWRLPGGGRKEMEDPREAVLREEIGMISHGAVERVSEFEDSPDYKRETASLFIVREVSYRPGWSLEVEAVTEARLDQLPDDVSDRTLLWLSLVRPRL